MTETRMSFLGIPIEGAKRDGSRRVGQWDLESFQSNLMAVLQDPFIESVDWQQYTPYFNDGDPCEFSVGHPSFRTVGMADDDDDDEEYDYDLQVSHGYLHPTLGGTEDWRGKGPYVGDHEALWNACLNLSDAMERGHYENVLLDAFGDHAKVSVRRDRIIIRSTAMTEGTR